MENVELLKKIEIFDDLTSYEAAKAGKLLKNRDFKKEDYIVRTGEEGDSIFIVKKGAVRVVAADSGGTEEMLALLGEGDHFGEIALIDKQPRSADVIANEDAEMLEMKKDDLENLLCHDNVMAVKIYRAFAVALCTRLREANENLLLMKQFKGS